MQIFERVKNNTHTTPPPKPKKKTPKLKMGLFSSYLIFVAVHNLTSQCSLFCHRLSTAQTVTEKTLNSQVLRFIQCCLIAQINLLQPQQRVLGVVSSSMLGKTIMLLQWKNNTLHGLRQAVSAPCIGVYQGAAQGKMNSATEILQLTVGSLACVNQPGLQFNGCC